MADDETPVKKVSQQGTSRTVDGFKITTYRPENAPSAKEVLREWFDGRPGTGPYGQ